MQSTLAWDLTDINIYLWLISILLYGSDSTFGETNFNLDNDIYGSFRIKLLQARLGCRCNSPDDSIFSVSFDVVGAIWLPMKGLLTMIPARD